VRSGPNTVRAGWILQTRRGAAIRWRQLQWPSFDASTLSRFHVERLARCSVVSRRLTRRASRGWTSLARTIPTSDVPCRSRAPLRGSNPRSQLVARSVTGRATFTREPEPSSEYPVRSTHSNDPERLPSYAALARFHVRGEIHAASC